MNSDYYLEVRRKSHQIEPSSGNETSGEKPIKKLNSENIEEENLLTDYELITNEELYEESTVEIHSNPDSDATPQFAIESNSGEQRKINICLGIQQIALKSQTTAKTNKSIDQEKEAQTLGTGGKLLSSKTRQRHHHQQQPQAQKHVPQGFSIVPISVKQKRAAGSDSNNLPEIVLTSFETKRSNEVKTLSPKRTTTVTFCSTFMPTSVTNEQQQPPSPIIPRVITTMLPPVPPPLPPAPPPSQQQQPEVVRPNCKDIERSATDSDRIQEEPPDDNENESNSQEPTSSTSPESYVDNILSAASSVSVRSSSLSSSAELAHFSGSGGAGGGGSYSSGGGGGGEGRGVGVGAIARRPLRPQQRQRQLDQQKQQRQLDQRRLQHIIMNNNRSLNSKTMELTNMSTTRHLPPPVIVADDCGMETERNSQTSLQPPPLNMANTDAFDTNSTRSRSPSPSRNSTRISPDPPLAFPEDLKCIICSEVFRDPRTLNCLHSFCFQCLVDENFKQDPSFPFWSQPGDIEEAEWKSRRQSTSLRSSKESSPELSLSNITGTSSPAPLQRQRSSFSFRRKKSLKKGLAKSKSDVRSSSNSSTSRHPTVQDEKPRMIVCKICNFSTELSVGGLRQLPQNFLLVRRIEEIKLKVGDDVITKVWCSLCFEETNATYHCITCTLNLCTLCKEAHERQRNTADHRINNILELRQARRRQQNALTDNSKFTLKCGMHPGFEMKSFCTTCLQIACPDCLVLLHKGHKHESIAKAFNSYSRILRDSTEQTRPLCSYAEHSMGRLNEIAKGINRKCDDILEQVETYMAQYFEAVEVHRKTMLQQVQRARESKVEMILEQQLDLEKRANEVVDAICFSQDLFEVGSHVELLSFVSLLLKRFEFCSQFRVPTDPKISDSLHFLPHIQAPSTKTQNNIPLFGIITMQTVEPSLCTLDTEAFSQLRVHKKAELGMLSRDADGVPLCHGGLQVNALLKYKEYTTKFLPVEVSDNRDGTYGLSFVPDSQGTMLLTVTISDKHIKGSPFTFLARTLRPHSGVYHCCAFCSSKGNKSARCSCQGQMPGYNGCGHGHAGHPGRRHWSCCGNVLQNSECSVANKMMNL